MLLNHNMSLSFSCVGGSIALFAYGFALDNHFWFLLCFVSFKGRLYAMQTGMKIDSKTPECRKFLSKLMDQLEAVSRIY